MLSASPDLLFCSGHTYCLPYLDPAKYPNPSLPARSLGDALPMLALPCGIPMQNPAQQTESRRVRLGSYHNFEEMVSRAGYEWKLFETIEDFFKSYIASTVITADLSDVEIDEESPFQ
ncbi:hypothetical protein FPRO06_01644 [Fusarium proliferatum]|nr:hypothetical protein FPRO06_01644 [Fusarium proliferatum]